MENIIRKTRLEKGLTQSEAASYLNMNFRTYQNYELGVSKRDVFKMNMIIKQLSKYEKYSENKGIYSIEEIKNIVNKISNNYKVSYVYLFGSYAKGLANEKSDIDLLIKCEERGFSFLALNNAFSEAFHKKVDLIGFEDLKDNQEFLSEILLTGVKIYGPEVRRQISHQKHDRLL